MGWEIIPLAATGILSALQRGALGAWVCMALFPSVHGGLLVQALQLLAVRQGYYAATERLVAGILARG
jgi:hypothetical protein